MPVETVLFFSILIVGFYLAWNIGANDVANAMGTSVGSGAITLRKAVLLAAILEFAGAFFFGSHVSETMQSGIINLSIFNEKPLVLVLGMLSSLAAAGIWLQMASYYGWPVSTTHSIVGAVFGFGAIVGGAEAVYWDQIGYIVSSWIISPLCGGLLAYAIFTLLRKKIFYDPNPVEAAKQLMPNLVFLVFSLLSLVLLYQGLKNIHIDFNFLESLAISVIVGGIAYAITYYLVKRMDLPDFKSKKPTNTDAAIALELDKAKKHLKNIQYLAHGELQYRLNSLLEEVEDVSKSVHHPKEIESTHHEFSVIENMFAYLQIISACIMAFAHGANDVANAIGPLSAAIAILSAGAIVTNPEVPTWALALGGAGIVIGLATWGWRVIYTIGKKITELTPTRGFASEFGAAATVLVASRLGMPISTTHTLVGAVLGVGLARGIEALNLNTTRDILISWIVTVPAGALLSVSIFYLLELFF